MSFKLILEFMNEIKCQESLRHFIEKVTHLLFQAYTVLSYCKAILCMK